MTRTYQRATVHFRHALTGKDSPDVSKVAAQAHVVTMNQWDN